MFRRILAPVDLSHLDRLDRAIAVTVDEARHHGAPVDFVTVTAATPGKLGHTPDEARRKLAAFAAAQSEAHGIEARAHLIVSHDPTTDIDDALLKAVEDTGADLVVMATHRPGLADRLWPSNGGKVATNSGASVLLVRDA
jgi:nucleotide-binding universal stress UspA family protein